MLSRYNPRVLAVVATLAVLAASCSSGTGRETDVPDVPEELQGTMASAPTIVAASCQLAFGEGQGAEIVAVTAGTPAEGAVQVGDVITQFDGEPIQSAAQLIDEVRLRAVGEFVPAAIQRDGEMVEVELPLIEHTDDASVAMIGIGVTTVVDLVDIDTLEFATPHIDAQLARVISVEDLLMVLDPLPGAWEKLAVSTPATPWAPAQGDIFMLEPGADGEAASIIPLLETVPPVEFAAGTWEARWLIGTEGDNVLVLADQDVDGQLAAALFSIDPASGSLVWSWLPGSDEEGRPLIPVLAMANPPRTRTLVALTSLAGTEAGTQSLAFVVLDSNGEPQTFRTPPEGALPANAVPIGWSAESTIAYVPPERDRILRWNINTGSLNEVVLPVDELPPLVIPVGDGAHYILVSTDSIDLVAGGEPASSRPLAKGCSADRVSGLGWGLTT